MSRWNDPSSRDSRDGQALRDARLTAGLSLESLSEASGVDIERLRQAEGTDAQVELTSEEWVRLAVVFEDHTLVEYKLRQDVQGPVKWLSEHGRMLESARRLVVYYFSTEDSDKENG